MKKKVILGVAGLSIIVVMLQVLGIIKTEDKKETTQQTMAQEKVETTPATGESIIAETTVASTVKYKSELEIIKEINHPHYYDSLDSAYEYWGEIDDDTVTIDKEKVSNKTILEIGASGTSSDNDRKIDSINIIFSNFKGEIPKSFEELIGIGYDYLPVSIIKNNYKPERTFQLVSNEKGEKHYFILYTLPDDGYYGKVNRRIVLQIVVKNDVCQNIVIGNKLHNWVSNPKLNGYEELSLDISWENILNSN